MVAGDITNLFEHWDEKTLKVSAPLKRVFVCGGTTDAQKSHDLSRRDAFIHSSGLQSLSKYVFIRAEDVEMFPPHGSYDDILTFEIDVSQIAHLVLLFSESPGSFAELGSFCMDKDIVQRLLVVIDDTLYDQDSFIRHGPIKFIEDLYPETGVLVVKTAEVGQQFGSRPDDIDKAAFARIIGDALKKRMPEVRDNQTFDANKRGHLIKLITGLIQDYGALKEVEIDSIMGCIGHPLNSTDLRRYAQCAEAMGWIKKDRRNFETYFTATSRTDALRFKFVKENAIDRSRWRTDIIQFWKRNDPDRFASIQSNRPNE